MRRPCGEAARRRRAATPVRRTPRALLTTLVAALLACLCLTLAVSRAAAQGPADAVVRLPNPPRPAPAPGAGVTVSLMTIGQGDAVWERYGHNAIVVHDAASGPDLAYNWGEFDFAQPNFLGRFLTGDTKYAMRAMDAALMADAYARQYNRAVWLQELALTPAQAASLVAFLRWTDTEAHRYYRYDYYNDNCSTRVRDALDRALGGALRAAFAGRPSGRTWRGDTRRLNAGDAPIYTGIQIALGRPADQPLDRWASGYLPLDLRAYVRDVRVPGADGRPVPLVRAEREVWGAPGRAAALQAVPSYVGWYALAGALAAVLLLVAGWTARAGGGAGRLLLGALGGVWALAVGALGTALLLAGTVTKHEPYMGRNWNLLGVNPLSLAVAGLVIAAVAAGRAEVRRRRARRAAAAAGLVAALAAAGVVAVLLPGVGQQSGELFALLVPAHLALWWALRQLAQAPAEPSTGQA